jgi:hypothetical protein
MVLRQPESDTDPGRDRTRPGVPDRLQGRYADPATSGLRAEINEGGNDLEPFRLSAAGQKAARRYGRFPGPAAVAGPGFDSFS